MRFDEFFELVMYVMYVFEIATYHKIMTHLQQNFQPLGNMYVHNATNSEKIVKLLCAS